MRDLKSKLLRALGVLFATSVAAVLTIASQGPLGRYVPQLKTSRSDIGPTHSALPLISPSLTGSSP